jgi:hypothetical protein
MAAAGSLCNVSSFVCLLIEIMHKNITNNNNTYCVGFEVLATVVVESSVVWDMKPCSLLEVNRLFGETYRLHLQV